MNIARLLTLLIISGCTLFSNNIMKADNTDFSRPQTVITDSHKELVKTIKDKDGPGIAASLIDITLAKSMIDNDSLQASLKLITSTQSSMKSDTALCSLLDLLKADILTTVYNRNRWVYDSRELPLYPIGEDMNSWSGKQFRQRIDSLIISSLAAPDDLDNQPISKWERVISVEKGSETVFPTLLDFVGFKAISLLRNRAMAPLTARWMTPAGTFVDMNTDYTSGADKIIIDTYQTLLDADKKHPVSAIYTDLDRLKWTGMRFTDSDAYFDAIENLALCYPEEPASILPLLSLVNNSRNDTMRAKRLISLLENYRSRFGQTIYDKTIDRALSSLKATVLSYSFPETVKKGVDFDIKFNARNCKKVTFSIYSINANGQPVSNVSSKSVTFDTPLPFSTDSVIQMSVPDNGDFAIYASTDDKSLSLKEYAPRLKATSIFPVAVGISDDKALFMAADIETGKPLGNVTVTTKNRENIIATGHTDKNGGVTLRPGNSARFKDTGNGDAELYTYSLYNRYDRNSTMASFSTSLPVYHPGDKLQWAMIAMNTGDKNRRPAVGQSFTIYFHDANNSKLDSLTGKTDRFGRISGEFKIPEGGLTGYFHLRAYSNSKKSYVGASSVMVSDYKLPTFTVSISDIERDTPSKGDITIKGLARTYTGFPIADAEITARLSALSWNFWRSNTDNFYSTTIRTDADGGFTITFSSNLLKQAPMASGLFAATFDVVSSAGETRSASCNFTTGKRYGISLPGLSSFDISSPVKINPEITDPSGNKVSIPVTFTLTKDKKEIGSFSISTPSQPVDFSKIAPGQYTLTVAPADTALADAASTDIVLYNSKVRTLDIDQMLWTPMQAVSFDNNSGELLLATDRDNLTVNMIVTSPDSLVSQKWITLDKGLSHIPVTLPEKTDRAAVTFITVNNFESSELRIELTTPPARRRLNIAVESFRDKVRPLEKERWTFNTDVDSTAAESAILLNIFSASINDIKSHSPFGLSPYVPVFHLNIQSGHLGQSFGHYSDNNGFNDPFNYNIPQFDLHGYSWTGNQIKLRGYATRAMTTNAMTDGGSDMVVEETVMMSAAPMAMKVSNADMAAGMISEDTAADTDAGDQSPAGSNSNDIRPSEVPLALFEPMLTTGKDGRTSVSFSWPNAVTEWIVNASGWDEDSRFATLVRHAVAAKSLMVNTNTPRFLRTGNHAVITSTIMNSTDSTLSPVKATIEIRSVADNSLIASADSILSLDRQSAATVTVDFDVDDMSSGLLVTSRATCDNFTDGEQSAIAVLPAAEPVIDTQNLYLAPGKDSTSVEIKGNRGEKTTLEVTLNPTWEVVTALPGLISDKPATSIDAALSCFSAMTAAGILKDNPEISNALDKWTHDDKDSVLVSALSRNPDLKSMMLDETPWVTDAMDDTRRMSRLSLLFDKSQTEANVGNAVKTLKSLERKKGGWAWSSYGDEPSEWATMNTLYILGNLKTTGYANFDKELESMITRAVLFIDNQMVERQKKSKELISDPLYAYIRSLYSEIPQSMAASAISSHTINRLVAGWKKLDVPSKAIAAQLLYRKNYRKVASSILESISQFATVSSERGMYWANIRSTQWWSTGAVSQTALILDAYRLINPRSTDIDRIRQWLILEKSRQNWGSGFSANLVITSILNSGSDWTSPATHDFKITLGNQVLTPDDIDRTTGYFRYDISNMVNRSDSTTLTITKDSATPAFGTVYNISPQKIEDIKPSDNIELAVDKKYYVRHVTPDGDQWIETDTFNVGDRVRTTLTIKSLVDLSYVTVNDLRPACIEPVNQLPETVLSDGIAFYRENRDTRSLMFIDFLPRGVYVIAQEFNVDRPGIYSSGTAEVASAYAPAYSVHSGGTTVISRP